MEAMTHGLALRYLLELSTDIRLALLLDAEGQVIAAAPETPDDRITRIGGELAREAAALSADGQATPVELDATVDGGAVFVVRDRGQTLLCVTGRFALPGLILHDMRTVLDDLHRAASAEGPTEKPGR
jgi:hypothetical protein